MAGRERNPLRELFARFLNDDDPRTLEAALDRAESTFARWSVGDSLRQILADVQRDVLARPGTWVALEAVLRVGGEARFRLDGVPVGDAVIDPHGEARTMIRAPAPGVYRVDLTVSAVQVPAGEGLLQVVGDAPVLLFDAALLDELSGARTAELVRQLHSEGFEVAWFHLEPGDPRAEVRARLTAHDLPLAAVLAYDVDTQNLAQVGVDLARLAALTAVPRLLARGVPVVGVVTARAEIDAARVQGAHRLTLDALDAPRRAELSAAGAAFLAAHRAADPLRWRLDRVSGAAARSDNALWFEPDNAQARKRTLALIDGARRTVHVQFYIVRRSRFTDALVVHLVRRARAGVTVRLMVDALYSERDAFEPALAGEPNLFVRVLAPIETARDVNVQHLKQRDHRKLLVVDGARAIVSGRNAGDEYFSGFDEVPIHDGTPHGEVPWLDAHVEVAGPLVADVEGCFVATWREHGGEAEDAAPVAPVADGADARLIVHHSLADVHGLATYQALIDSAESHVLIVNNFPIVNVLARAILQALARGVRVQLLTGCATARRGDRTLLPAPLHRTLFEHMMKGRLEPLIQAGMTTYEYAPPATANIVVRGGRVRPYVHAKIVSVDGRACSVGSANLDAAASFWESEAIVVVEDVAFTGALEARLAAMIANSYRIDPTAEDWQRERVERALVSRLWPDWMYS